MNAKHSTLNRLMESTGKRPNNCTCPDCQNLCKEGCFCTPADAMELIKNGYGCCLEPGKTIILKQSAYDFLKTMYKDFSITGLLFSVPFVKKDVMDVFMVRTKYNYQGCIFYQNQRCALHEKNLKPIHCLLSDHHKDKPDIHVSETLQGQVVKEWADLDGENTELIAEIKKQLGINT